MYLLLFYISVRWSILNADKSLYLMQMLNLHPQCERRIVDLQLGQQDASLVHSLIFSSLFLKHRILSSFLESTHTQFLVHLIGNTVTLLNPSKTGKKLLKENGIWKSKAYPWKDYPDQDGPYNAAKTSQYQTCIFYVHQIICCHITVPGEIVHTIHNEESLF